MGIFKYYLLALFFVSSIYTSAQDDKKTKWVDSVFSKLKTEEKIGQLFVVPFSTRMPKEEFQLLLNQCKAGKIGGLIIQGSGPMGYAKSINKLQSNSKIPLLVGANINFSLASAFDSTMVFFETNVLNAISNDSLLYSLSHELSRQKDLLHIHFPFHSTRDSIRNLKVFDVRLIPTKAKSKNGEEERQGFLLGNDLLSFPKNIDAAIKVITKSIKKDKVLAAQLDQSVKKILSIKFDDDLWKNKFVDTDNLMSRLHTPEANLLKLKLTEAAVTVVRNDAEIIPIQKIDNRSFTSVSLGEGANNEFTHYLSKYDGFKHYSVKTLDDTVGLSTLIKDKDVIVIGLFPTSASMLEDISGLINRLPKERLIVCSFGSPMQLSYFEKIPTWIAAYSDEEGIPRATAEIIFGGIGARGKLSVNISDSLSAGKSIKTKAMQRFVYSLPEDADMNSTTLKRIEPIAQEAISIGATPGCHILVARNGKVIYEKSFGSLSYDKKIPVSDETIYDLASVTKVSATLQTVMYMHEKGLIDINKKASVYLPELKGSNKEDFIIKDILTHQAGLWPYLPFWAETVKDSIVTKKYYGREASEDFPFPVAENLYAAKSMKDSLWQWIIKSKIREKPSRTVYDYRYSDMGFYIMQHLAEKMIGEPMEDFLQKNIYQPLGASTLGYLPLRKFPLTQIAPTEKDTLFRKSLLVGYVHDQGAAMHGGIAGHAGLFSDANDLAKLGQMWLNQGSYGGVEFFKPETINFFTAKQYTDSRRGLGWDKPIASDWNSPVSMYASSKTFGHTGFTGTCIWIDPEFNLVYVFLSNRVNPDMNNNKILNANIRPRIQEVIYQYIFSYCKNHTQVETK
jgi:CubicO group peptidase (beta-lactamase class C family)